MKKAKTTEQVFWSNKITFVMVSCPQKLQKLKWFG